MRSATLYRGRIASVAGDRSLIHFADGAIVVDSAGRIADVGDYTVLRKKHVGVGLVDLAGGLIVPGMVDTHVHLPQYPAVGLYGKELLDWLATYIFPLERSFTPDRAERLAPRFFRDLLAHGVTTAVVYCSIQADSADVVFECAKKAGIRAIIGKVMMDRNAPQFLTENTNQSIADSEQLCKKWNGACDGRLMYAFTPRFAPTCSSELMAAAADLARQHGAYLQTHLAENPKEIEWVHKLFPEARSYTDVYARHGMLGPRSLFAHAIYLNSDERSQLLEQDCALAHCPTSNLFLKSGLMPLRELMDLGLRIGLGSDVAGGPTLSLFEVMRDAIYVHNARRFNCPDAPVELMPADAFRLATVGGAQALGLADRIGSLEVGKEADFVVIDAAKLDPPLELSSLDSSEALISCLIFRGGPQAVQRTYIHGRLCFDRADSLDDHQQPSPDRAKEPAGAPR